MARATYDIVPCLPDDIRLVALNDARRALMFGPPGVGKTTLAAGIADALARVGRACWCINADPGSPSFGLPGVVSLGLWTSGAWRVVTYEALCTLDAGRFRLPLIAALARIVNVVPREVVLVDGPGIVRGMAGAELVQALIDLVQVDLVLALTDADREPPLLNELRACGAEIQRVERAPQARRPGKRARARARTLLWDAYLTGAKLQTISLADVNLVGMPPPLSRSSAWEGRQVALLQGARTLTMGEVEKLDGSRLYVKLPRLSEAPDTVIVRDALRSTAGLIETAPPFVSERLTYLPPPEMSLTVESSGGPRVMGRVGVVDVNLVNGVFGDPMLHARLRHQCRSLLFDLGEGGRLAARIAHQVTDVFISHAHMDHIGGFFWLLRSRIGDFPTCRLYGPPGLADHVESLLNGILWDRVGERGPRFLVAELHGDRLKCCSLRAGCRDREPLDDITAPNGVLLREAGFHVRAVTLDHHTPVLAFAFEPAKDISIRKDRLIAQNLLPGPWLGELKQHLLAEKFDAKIGLPDASVASVRELGEALTRVNPAKNMVYATDFADTQANRERIVALAKDAHTLFCEASFMEAEAEQAARTGHLTTRACGEIATAAGVARLVPFHFSRRYAEHAQPLFEELKLACDRVLIPDSMSIFE